MEDKDTLDQDPHKLSEFQLFYTLPKRGLLIWFKIQELRDVGCISHNLIFYEYGWVQVNIKSEIYLRHVDAHNTFHTNTVKNISGAYIVCQYNKIAIKRL